MIKDAKKEGMYLLLNSGYRSYEEQEKSIKKLNKNMVVLMLLNM